MFQFIRIYLTDFVESIFPEICIGCRGKLGPNESVLCTKCLINLPITDQHKEPYNTNLLNKFAGKVPIAYTSSYLYFTKGGIVQRIMHAIKYRGRKEAAVTIAKWYGHQLKQESNQLMNIDFLVGVPLHKDRLRQRGYNQADYVAQGLSEGMEIPYRVDVLKRNTFVSSQTNKSRLARWENVHQVFAIVNKEVVKNKRIAIVDDVLTTGATIEACAAILLEAGCESISVITLAVAGK